MITRTSCVIAFIILISNFVYSQAVAPSPWSNCNFSKEETGDIEKWLNESFNEAKRAINDGRKYNGKDHKLEKCKIDEINNLFNKLKFEYDCSCGDCGRGGPSHEYARGIPVIRICQPGDMYEKRFKNDLDKPQVTVCGCIQGLIVHELVHAAGDPTEEGAVDCSKILYPCANDPFTDATKDHENCKCCEKKG